MHIKKIMDISKLLMTPRHVTYPKWNSWSHAWIGIEEMDKDIKIFLNKNCYLSIWSPSWELTHLLKPQILLLLTRPKHYQDLL